ncbi:CoA ester lyase [archaeon]|jgi:citrate lyase subunit beta / citryl-CoA lyase|nr:CoA ester lyase [archaeon]MBT7128501.1 CoA ester lyase [archaeon]
MSKKSIGHAFKRKSLLVFPAIKKRYYSVALESEADSLEIDLEDSIASSSKTLARDVLCEEFPKDYSGKKELMVRINDFRSKFYEEDVELIKNLKPDTISFAKVERAEDIKQLESSLLDAGIKNIDIFVGIESLSAFYNMDEILGSSKKITAAILGVEDLVAELGIERGEIWKNPILNYMLIEFSMKCRMYGIQSIGPITRGYSTPSHFKELAEECAYLKKMGFVGKVAIHPSQIEIINREFEITSEQILDAQNIIDEFKKKELKDGTAVIISSEGMEDSPSLKKAKDILKYAEDHGFPKN